MKSSRLYHYLDKGCEQGKTRPGFPMGTSSWKGMLLSGTGNRKDGRVEWEV